jgi:hypothetical protein
MEKKTQNIGTIVKGNLFDTNILLDNYKLIIFLVTIAMISIVSSHAIDTKVYKITTIKEDVRELKSEFVSVRTQLMNSRMGSNLQAKVKNLGLEVSTTPPQVITVETE